MASPQAAPVQLNLGCGHVCPEGWINVDGSNRAWLASRWPLVDRALVSLKLIAPTEFSRATTSQVDVRRRIAGLPVE